MREHATPITSAAVTNKSVRVRIHILQTGVRLAPSRSARVETMAPLFTDYGCTRACK